MKTNIIYILILLISSLSLNIWAQDYGKHEFSAYAGGGLNTFKYSDVAPSFDTRSKMGAQFGISYTYMFKSNWGVSSGVEMAFYKAKVNSTNFSDSFSTNDIDNTSFEYRIKKASGLKEELNSTFINIPIMLKFQTTGNLKLYAAGGAKIGIPVKTKAKGNIASIASTAYYPEDNYEYTDAPFMGAGTFNNVSSKETVKFKTSVALALELGTQYAISESNDLHAAAYFDYGLNNIIKNKAAKRLVNYNAQSSPNFNLNSIIGSEIFHDSKTIDVVKKIVPMAIGLKIGMTFIL